MSDRKLFETAVAVVLEHEGSDYTVNPLDSGGATKYGIAKRWNPGVNIAELTREQAIEIYRDRYWNGQRYDRLPEVIAIKAFDLAVNMGKRSAVICLQRALRAVGLTVVIDGVLGPETWTAASEAEPFSLLAALRSEAAGEYRVLVARNGDQAAFLRGWLNRAYS